MAMANRQGFESLVWNIDNIRDVAESVGISALSEEVVRDLSHEVEYRIGQVIVEAMRFMHQGRRTVLGTQDITQALRRLDVEPLYGYESTRPLRFGEASLGPGQPLFYIEDEEVDFEKLINAPLPKVPRDMTFTAHWLAVEGVQPSIPQNPTTAEARSQELLPKGPGANPSLAAMAGNDNVSTKPLVKHILSKELLLYFDKIRAALLDEEDEEEAERARSSALESVRSDPGLHQLVPYFVNYIAEKVTHSLKNIFVLHQMMLLAAALIANKSLFIEPYVTPLMPPILTCLVGRKLGADAHSEGSKEQYDLRCLAASLIGAIGRKYDQASSQLKTRLARTCLKHFLDPTKPLTVHFGAIKGLQAVCGSEAVRLLILPNLRLYDQLLAKVQSEKGEDSADVHMVLGAIMEGLQSLVDGDAMVINGGDDGARVAQLKELLGPIVGARVASEENSALAKAVLEASER